MVNVQKQTGSILIIGAILATCVIIGTLGYFTWRDYDQPTAGTSDIMTSNEPIQLTEKHASGESDYISTVNIFIVEELGIALTLPKSFDDLTYRYDDQHNIAWFSTRSLTEQYEGCSASGIAPPLGSLNKTQGVYPEDPNMNNSNGVLIKQFEGYYIGYSGPQSLCSDDQIASPAELPLFEDSLATLKEL